MANNLLFHKMYDEANTKDNFKSINVSKRLIINGFTQNTAAVNLYFTAERPPLDGLANATISRDQQTQYLHSD